MDFSICSINSLFLTLNSAPEKF
jgi:hypothetical protein